MILIVLFALALALAFVLGLGWLQEVAIGAEMKRELAELRTAAPVRGKGGRFAKREAKFGCDRPVA